MSVTTKLRVRWTAARDRVAHAHTRASGTRTLCGLPAIAERDGWQPEIRRCEGCTALVAEADGRLV